MQKKRKIVEKDLLAKLYQEEKLSIRQVAGRLGRNYQVVRRSLLAHQIPLRPLVRFSASPMSAEVLRNLYLNKNLTAAQIAERIGYSVSTVSKKLSKLGIRKLSGRRAAVPVILTPAPQPEGLLANDALPKDHRVKSVSLEREALSAFEIAEKYKTHVTSVRKLIRAGVFPHAFRQRTGTSRGWMVPADDLKNFLPRKRGRIRIGKASARTIASRASKAGAEIRNSHGYGKVEINEMANLERAGWTRTEIGIRFRLDEKIVTDLLEFVTFKLLRPKKPAKCQKELKRLPESSLIELYVVKQYSIKFIIAQLGTNALSFYKDLRHYGIPLRSNQRRAREREQMLRQMVIEEKLLPGEIADRLKITPAHVKRKLKELELLEPES